MVLQAGVARASLTPHWGVELAGWGYYLNRTWTRGRDPLAATALVLENGNDAIGLVAVDLLYADVAFTRAVRQQVSKHIPLQPDHICIGCSHSHNSPTLALIRGAGEIDADYRSWAERQVATALIEAWHRRESAQFFVGKSGVEGWTHNRADPKGTTDNQLSLWRIDRSNGMPLAVVVGFQAHPTVMMGLGATDVSRDFPGMVTDGLEDAIPGAMALYFQGACGDVNFLPRYNEIDHCREPGEHLLTCALEAWEKAVAIGSDQLGAASIAVELPTRRWTMEEIQRDREEGRYRLETGSTEGWRENLGRVMVNKPDQFPSRYGGDLKKAVMALGRFGLEWTEAMLIDLETRPEAIVTEVQALRLGDAWMVANPSELYTSLALEVRKRWPHEHLMHVGYANDSIGYMPDAADMERKSYAANQSPKFKNQFPFVPESCDAIVAGMLEALEAASKE